MLFLAVQQIVYCSKYPLWCVPNCFTLFSVVLGSFFPYFSRHAVVCARNADQRDGEKFRVGHEARRTWGMLAVRRGSVTNSLRDDVRHRTNMATRAKGRTRIVYRNMRRTSCRS